MSTQNMLINFVKSVSSEKIHSNLIYSAIVTSLRNHVFILVIKTMLEYK